MKTITPELLTFLLGNDEYRVCDLLTLTLSNGDVYRYNNSDLPMDLVVSGNTYKSSGVRFERGQVQAHIGVEVSTLQVTFYATSSDLLGAQPFLQACRTGALEGARLRLDRLFLSAWLPPVAVGTVNNFTGIVATLDAGRTSAHVTVKSDLVLLNVMMPHNVYQPPCLHTLYDTGCGLNREDFKVSTSVTGSASTKLSLVASALTQDTGYFTLGYVRMTSGDNDGIRRTVLAFTPGVVSLLRPLPFTPAVADTFDIFPGCDKLQTTCNTKFNNLTKFRGMPYIPVPETIT